jgi:hypothetical protein
VYWLQCLSTLVGQGVGIGCNIKMAHFASVQKQKQQQDVVPKERQKHSPPLPFEHNKGHFPRGTERVDWGCIGQLAMLAREASHG